MTSFTIGNDPFGISALQDCPQKLGEGQIQAMHRLSACARLRLKSQTNVRGAWLRSLLAFLVLLIVPNLVSAAGRVALLVGNADYDLSGLSLKNPANDVAAMADKLRTIGFEVTEVLDAEGAEMSAALIAFQAAMNDAEVALFYYGGHGVEVAGENYLIGTDFADITTGLSDAALPITSVRNAMSVANPGVGLIILDACRDNPFAAAGITAPGLARAQGGLGLLIAFAAEPGKTAFDGKGDNSVFTQALLDNIATDGVEIRIMLGRVRQQVALATSGGQAPLVEDGTIGENFLGAPQADALAADEFAQEVAVWRVASATTDVIRVQDYLTKYPNGLFVAFARERVAELDRLANKTLSNSTFADLVKSDPARIGAALEGLGFLAKAAHSETDLAAGFANYAASLPVPSEANVARLFTDAAGRMAFLAAATAQKLRTDLVALSSVGRTLEISESALAEIKAIAQTNADAEPVLQVGEADIAEIRLSRDRIMLRLDGTRTYYDDLLKSVYRNFTAEMRQVESGWQNNAAASGVEKTMAADIARFARQVAEMTPDSEGTMAWLADFVPKG